MTSDIQSYHNSLATDDRAICDSLFQIINKTLSNAEHKIWYKHPVWFLDGNPIVGYHKLKDSVRLMFWSGQSFDEPNLTPDSSFKAATIRYIDVDQIDTRDLKRWLEKSKSIQWDYKNIVQRKGELIRLK
ncbi:MAG: DUF1801 domain-containing protein [Aquaticitalea sp.]